MAGRFTRFAAQLRGGPRRCRRRGQTSAIPIRLPFRAARFPGPNPALPGHDTLVVDWPDLVWASITVGRWRTDVFLHGIYSRFEAVHRAGIIYANLRDSGSGRLCRSALYGDLDRSEKAIASYYIGMACTKLLAAERLNVPWLVHVDRYQHIFGIAFTGTKRRPDLIGPDAAQRWLVAEAKGRTGGADREVIRRLRDQKRAVQSVNGQPPNLAIGAVSHFDRDGLALRVVDPEDDEPEPVNYSIDLDAFLIAYYRPLVNLLRDAPTEERDGGAVRTIALPEVDLSVGLDERVYQLVATEANSISGAASQVFEITSNNLTGSQRDGSVVVLGDAWDAEVMRQGLDEPGSTERR